MAAEVPAKDVLCEAMEYLSKLGSNLRTRSDNLREKKIRRDKLNNVLAVQKAASKVLIICELSKKSLENVETGVRKVMDIIDAAQGSSRDGGKTSRTENKAVESKSKYYYFEYKSRKIRIKKRITLKHYTSARVLARSMPKSMIDKYPVHYDCKLYRMRKCEERMLKKNSECNNENNFQEDSSSAQQERHHGIIEKKQDKDMSIISIPDSPICKPSIDKNVDEIKIIDYREKDMSLIISFPDTRESKSEGTDRKRSESDESAKNADRRKPTELLKEKSRDGDQSQKMKQCKEIKEKKYSSGKISDLQDNKEGEKHHHKNMGKSSDASDNKKKRFKKVRLIDDSSDDEKKADEEKTKENLEVSSTKNDENDVSCHEPEPKKRKLSESVHKTQNESGNEQVVLESSGDEKRDDKDEQNKDSEIESNIKPLIKCVSLSKLLKPDVLVKEKIKKPHSKPKSSSIMKEKTKPMDNEAEKNRKKEKLARKVSEEEEYWFPKRKEVESFISKNFVINVTRLPEFSVDYLNKQSLKKITQGGVTICEAIDEIEVADLNDNHDEINTTKKNTDESIAKSDEAKKDLSQASNSNSDTDDNDLIAEANKVKDSLLHGSDSDGDAIEVDKEKSAKRDSDTLKNALLNESDSDGRNNSDNESESIHTNKKNEDSINVTAQAQKSAKSDTDTVKSALLNESDSDGKNNSDNESESTHINKKNEDSIIVTAQAQKSAKRDSDTVKSALLNESDSDGKNNSDNELESVHKNKKNEDSIKVIAQTQNAKNALCYNSESDSDKNGPEKKVKNTLLNKSDSENRAKPATTQGEEVQKTLLNESSSESESNTLRLVYESDSVASTTSKNDGSHNVEDKNGNDKEKDQDNLLKKQNDENLSESHKNEKTPEKESSPGLSDDNSKIPLSLRITPQSKKKRTSESIHAKKMLMTYSSNSDTEDEQLKNALREIKNSLLHGSDEENSSKKDEQKPSRDSSPSSAEEIIKKVKKKIIFKSDSSKEKRVKHKRRKHRKRLDSEDSAKNGNSDNSKSSSSQMVRSKSKPGNSSSQNSDAQDSNDKDIDGLTNMNTLNKAKTRRRRSSSSEEAEDSSGTNTRSRRSTIKPTGLICSEMLKAESSSDEVVSASDEDKLDDDELPPVTLPSFNGGVEHLVKEDLLGESDSSLSEDETADKDDSDDEDKLNARRRKANAMISSDSEVGSSRKKDADVKLSDFEDSDDSELTKRSKRKKKVIDSDASVGSNSSNEVGKKKRRRIKSLRDSDMSGSGSENEGRNKHGRKNIRKVMGKNQLEEATKKAAREEKERIARITERQKTYNNLEFDESGKPDEVVLDKVILDFDPETKEPLIEVDRGLVKKLKPHQANGIKFMWDACFESAKRIRKDRGSGCILAHCMGLGKTLQVVALTHTLLTHSDLTKVNRVLVVCPLSTVLNWVNEFRMWLKFADTENEVDVYELSKFKPNSERAFQLSQWFEHGGVCVLGYEMFRNLSADNNKKFKKKMLKNFQEALVDPGPDLVVCDEGHLLKNEKTSLSQSMNRVRTHRRIVLTGTPLQNNLKEYYCMVQFVKPNLLGKYNEYLNRFVNPITNGQYTDSTEFDIKIMKRRSHVLHKMLDGAVQRRDYGVLAPFLPPKHEYVLFITLSEVQTKLYQHYLDNFSRRPLPGRSSGFLFPDFQSLQRIWTHPLVLKYNSERYEIMQQKKRDKEEEDSEGSLVDFIDDDSTPTESTTEESSDDSSIVSDDSRKKSKKKKSSKKNKGKGKDKDKDKDIKEEGGQSKPRRGTRANPIEILDDEKEDDIIEEVRNENPTEWWIKLVEEDELDDLRNSHKLVLLFDILRQCETIGDKLLVFSQSLYSLDLIEHFLGKVDEATQEGRIDEKLGSHVGSWSQGIDYFRLDGSTSCENRSIWCKNFNREDNPRARLFLISTRAGGLGINLVAANRVVIFDVSWNPSHDVQSIFRVYRFGQKKPCYVYRFLAMGTMEEKIYERQVTKQAISKRVIDEQQIDRHYAENDLAELYTFEPTPPVPRPIPPLPKDRLFAEMLREHEAQIYKYHEHDSLLENKEEETLSEEERKAAWEDFENEKNRPPPAPFTNPWPMHNGMVSPGLLVQQQQLAYAALAAMLRKDMPNLSDNQLRDMLPLIYNANPQLMQKMSELYKYPQAGMMNPAMMNPGVMNAASGGGGLGAMGSASGLQYEPPWQRQQQQQQQMRLQQLMQQQNQMGAKFYAGGLGSRDPVAMALQQQRAREIMLGNSGGGASAGAGASAGTVGRPRGRPPMQPRAPPPGDVVNLDSD